MVVPVPASAVDFNFDSTCSSPYMTAPSSPQRFGNFFCSAPGSPTHFSAIYREFQDVPAPSRKEERPRTSKIRDVNGKEKGVSEEEDEDFEFNFSGQLERTSLSADELFDGGRIRPLKPPTGYDTPNSNLSSPRSPRSPSRNSKRKISFDPVAAAAGETRNRGDHGQINQQQQKRGRERVSSSSSSSSYVHKGSRSLSPLRVSDIMLEQEQDQSSQSTTTTAKIVSSTTSNQKPAPPSSSWYAASFLSAISFSSKGHRKWRLKDLLLFRSASEGRATSKDPLKKYSVLSRGEPEDVRNSSFRSTESTGSSVSGSRRRGHVSAHEMHYTVNRAVSEELKRKTYLPYKQGLLGCLGFNPGGSGMHEISRGIGSMTRGRS